MALLTPASGTPRFWPPGQWESKFLWFSAPPLCRFPKTAQETETTLRPESSLGAAGFPMWTQTVNPAHPVGDGVMDACEPETR